MQLATIEKILSARNHPNADLLDLVTVKGWQVIVKRGEFKEGDLCVYVQMDTVLEPRPEYKFLESKHYRIKPIRLRGMPSAGICFPLSLLSPNDYVLGQDVTGLMGVSKYEKPLPAQLAGTARSNFPGWLRVTDEPNLRTYPDAVEELKGKEIVITIKQDGSSASFYYKGGEFGVCSRRLDLLESENNSFWKIARQLGLEQKLKKINEQYHGEFALQGELYGEGIQKNPAKIKGVNLVAFNLFDISKQEYCSHGVLEGICQIEELPMVKVIYRGPAFECLADYIKLANEQFYDEAKTIPAEGIVIRPVEECRSMALGSRLSVKVINENYVD